MSTSPHAPQAAGTRHWTLRQVQGPRAGKESLLPQMKTLVSISKTLVFLWSLEGVSQQPEIQEWGTSGAARRCWWNCSCKRQKQQHWQHECKLHHSLLCFFWKSSLHMFQHHAKKSPNNILSNHRIYVLRKKRKNPWVVLNTWKYSLTPLAQEVLKSQTICRRLREREYSRYPFAWFSTEHLL